MYVGFTVKRIQCASRIDSAYEILDTQLFKIVFIIIVQISLIWLVGIVTNHCDGLAREIRKAVRPHVSVDIVEIIAIHKFPRNAEHIKFLTDDCNRSVPAVRATVRNYTVSQ